MMPNKAARRTILVVFLILAMLSASAVSAFATKRVILMIGDGMGFKHVEAARNYVGSELAMQTLPVKYGMTTFERGGSYDSAHVWSDFSYVKSGATDSAAAGTAIATGAKTASGHLAVNHDKTSRLKTISEYAREAGWGSGVVSSVQFSHATPAAFAAHNSSRGNYGAIAREMIIGIGDGTGAWGNTPTLDVIIGSGHPAHSSGFVTAAEYDALKAGTTGQGWTFVERQAEVKGTDSLATAAAKSSKLFGLYGGSGGNLPYRLADGSGRNTENPALADMSIAALNVLNRNPNGAFLMIEGGAIDWAAHGNNIDKMIGEMIDFDDAVAAVVNWVKQVDPGWKHTLLIVTSDHETGYLTKGTGEFANVPLGNPGTGVLPTAGTHFAWNSGGHTHSLVPLYAKGMGSHLFAIFATAYDSGFGLNYLDNTDIFEVMRAAMAPETASAAKESAVAE